LPGEGGRSLAEVLLEPTRIYVRELLPLVQAGKIKGLAHITGGGLLENIPRVLPGNCRALIDVSRWQLPPVFAYLQQGGSIDAQEMARTFNCGIGMAVIVEEGLLGELSTDCFEIGRVEAGPRGCTVKGPQGSWGATESWSATHNA
jgi:phosphoribosylformylglycinamidine cyclo-ligase